jgi:hypothetical protein
VQLKIYFRLACYEFLWWMSFSDLKESRKRVDRVQRVNLACAYYDTFVVCTGAARSANRNSRPLIRIDSPSVISIGMCATTQSRDYYLNLDFGKSRLPSLSRFCWWRGQFRFYYCISNFGTSSDTKSRFLLRLLRFVLLTVNCTSSGTPSFTNSTSRDYISTTCTTSTCTFA